jgi:hypothetical protein
MAINRHETKNLKYQIKYIEMARINIEIIHLAIVGNWNLLFSIIHYMF